jgi:hypothetical protein
MESKGTTSVLVLLERLFWILVGPMILLALVVGIIRTGNGWLTATDFAYFGVLGGVMLARWLEFRSGQAQTAYGTPATTGDLRRYALGLAAVGLTVWVIANVIGNHVLSS